MMNDPLAFAHSAVSVVLGHDAIPRRNLDEMTLQELEARARMNEERLRIARQAGWIGGFGSGFFGALTVAKMLK
jgi:hypothetical protein